MKKTSFLIIIFLGFIMILSCGKKNETVRTEVLNQVWNHLSVGSSEYAKGDYENASLFLDQALDEAYSIDNIPLQISVLISLCELNIAQGDFIFASNNIFMAWDLAKINNIDSRNFSLFSTTGKYYSKLSNYALALEHYGMALKATGKRTEKAIVFNNMGNIYRRSGEYRDALYYLNRALRINRRRKIYNQMANNYYNIGEVYRVKEEWSEALNYYEKALESDKISENTVGIVSDLQMIARSNYKMGNSITAVHHLERAYNTALSAGLEISAAEISLLITEYQGEDLLDVDATVTVTTTTTTTTTTLAPVTTTTITSTNTVTTLEEAVKASEELQSDED